MSSVFGLPPKDKRGESWHVVTVTEQSMLKKSDISELPGPSAQLFTLVKVNPDDKLISVRLSDGDKEIFLATSRGLAIRFTGRSGQADGIGSRWSEWYEISGRRPYRWHGTPAQKR